MKVDLSPQALDTINLSLQTMLVSANATIAELRGAVQRSQIESQEAERAATAAAATAAVAARATPAEKAPRRKK